MLKIGKRRGPGRVRENGFALAISLLLVSLLMILALGLLGMASIELRSSSRGELAAQARANARLALVKAIGQLQRTMGPDQRVSASAEILRKPVSQPHWTGVWRSVQDNGAPFLTRDDLAGGLRDARWETKTQPSRWGARMVGQRPKRSIGDARCGRRRYAQDRQCYGCEGAQSRRGGEIRRDRGAPRLVDRRPRRAGEPAAPPIPAAELAANRADPAQRRLVPCDGLPGGGHQSDDRGVNLDNSIAGKACQCGNAVAHRGGP